MQDPKSLYHRYRVFFTKQGPARFIGHLDLQTLISRALKRAALPIAYSQGFNPHQLLSIALPLSLGMAGKNEIFEAYFTEQTDTNDIVLKLNKQMPQGITIQKAEQIPTEGKSAAALIYGAKYLIHLKENFITNLNLTDLTQRPDIFNIKITNRGLTIEATLAAGSAKNLKPQKFIELLNADCGDSHFEPENIHYERIELLL